MSLRFRPSKQSDMNPVETLVVACLNRTIWHGFQRHESTFAIVPRTLVSLPALAEFVRTIADSYLVRVYASESSIGILCRISKVTESDSPVAVMKPRTEIAAPSELYARWWSRFLCCWIFMACCRCRAVETDFALVETKTRADFDTFIESNGFVRI